MCSRKHRKTRCFATAPRRKHRKTIVWRMLGECAYLKTSRFAANLRARARAQPGRGDVCADVADPAEASAQASGRLAHPRAAQGQQQTLQNARVWQRRRADCKTKRLADVRIRKRETRIALSRHLTGNLAKRVVWRTRVTENIAFRTECAHAHSGPART